MNTRREFLRTLMVGAVAATIPLKVAAAKPQTPAREGRINYSTHGHFARGQGKSRYQCFNAINEALQGTNVCVWTSKLDYQLGMYRAIAKVNYGRELCFVSGTEGEGRNPTRTYRLEGARGAGLITFMGVG